MSNDVFTLDENNNAAIRTLGVNPGSAETNSPSVFTIDENGNACIRVSGSGGGSVDETKVIVLSDTIPTADADSLGKFYCYKGATNASYTHGYIYECVAGTPTYTGTVSFEAATTSGTTVTCSGDDFANFLTEAGADPTPIVSGTMTYDVGADGWRLVGKDAEDNTVTTFIEYTQDYLDHGFVFTGVPVNDDVIAFTCTVEEVSTYSWERVDVQPAAKLGRYLSGWNCATGLAMTNPQESPYEYTTGDYYIVGVVATGGASNYKPNGSSYTIGVASTTVETEVVNINDTYLYDGTNWTLLKTGSAVTSINGQTGDVSLDINDVAPTQTGKSGYVLGTDGFVAGWVKPEIVQRSALPQASEEEVDKIYQYVGTTDANYTNGYFYKCVSDGQNPATYSWENIEVQEADALPSQTGNAGKFLQTNGTDVAWATAAQVSQPSTMPTLAVADWALDSLTGKYMQTVNVTGVTTTNTVIVSPIPANSNEYGQCGVNAIAQGSGTLTFSCDVVPSNALVVNVIMLS